MAKFYAQPYSMSATGFYFSSPEGFEQKSKRNIDPGTGTVVEEYAFDFIDGSDAEAKLWHALSGGGGFFDIQQWYDDLEDLSDEDKAKAYWLADNLGMDDVQKILDKVDDVSLFEGDKKDYAYDLIDDIGVENVTSPDFYFDYNAFGRDLAFDMDPDDEADAYYLGLTQQERGEEYVDSMGGLGELGKKTQQMYFDYDAYARDMDINGEIDEFDFAGTTYTVTNANAL